MKQQTNAKVKPVRDTGTKSIVQSNNARRRGHEYERLCVNLLKQAGFPHVVTTRSESRNRDNDKIDLMNRNETLNGRLRWDIQCKNYSKLLDYREVLESMVTYPGTIKVIFHQLTSNLLATGKGKKNSFSVRACFAILYKKDFIRMMGDLNRYEQLYGKLPELSPEPLVKRIQVSKKPI